MPERTQITAQDEPPTTTPAPVRAGLRWMAKRLRTVRPYGEMLPSTREALARRCGYDQHGYTDAADQLYEQLLMRMPHVLEERSREDYAASLAIAAGDEQ